METNYTKRSILLNGVFTIVIAFFTFYIGLLMMTLGASVISGVLVSLMFLKVGLVGFVLLVILKLFGVNFSKLVMLTISVVTNSLSELMQSAIRDSGKVNQIGDTVIVRHHEVTNSLFEISDFVWIVMVSSLLSITFFWLLKRKK